MATIKLYFPVNNIEEVLKQGYDQVKVYRATTRTGTYAEITTEPTRIRLEPGVALYTYYDDGGAVTDWYKSTFYKSTATTSESSFSDPVLGDDAEVLTGIMTVNELMEVYLFGLDLTDDAGNEYPPLMYDFAIRAAISWLETQLDMDLRPKDRVEQQNYDGRQFSGSWGNICLDRYPVLSVESVTLNWPSLQAPFEFPEDWIRLDGENGTINIVPTAGSVAQGMLMGAVMGISGFQVVPNGLEISYQSGFEYGQLPHDIRALIGRRASFPILNTAGDLIAGAGIANFSMSVDGLSQSIGTTSSATNSGYGARLVQYTREIKEEMKTLRRHYKRVGLAMG